MAHTFSFMSYKHYAGGLQPDPHVISDALKWDLLPDPAKKSSKYVLGPHGPRGTQGPSNM